MPKVRCGYYYSRILWANTAVPLFPCPVALISPRSSPSRVPAQAVRICLMKRTGGQVWTETDAAKNKDSYHPALLSILTTTWPRICLAMQARGIDHRQDPEDERCGEVCLFMDLHVFFLTQNREILSILLTGVSLPSRHRHSVRWCWQKWAGVA